MKPTKKIYRFLAALSKVLDAVQRNISIVAFCVMTVVILIGIVMRFLLKIPNMWGEEVSRYSMIIGVFFAIGLGSRNKEHMRIDMLLNALPKKLANALEFFSRLVEIAAYSFFAYLSYRFVSRTASFGQKSPSLQLPMWIMYAVLFVGFILTAIEIILTTWNDFLVKEQFLVDESGEPPQV